MILGKILGMITPIIISCAPVGGMCPMSSPVYVSIEHDYMIEPASDAMDFWNTHGDLFHFVGGCDRWDHCVRIGIGDLELPTIGKATSYDHHGLIYRCEITISPVSADSWRVYAHELGHCLGMCDVDDPASIMYYAVPSFPAITDYEIGHLTICEMGGRPEGSACKIGGANEW